MKRWTVRQRAWAGASVALAVVVVAGLVYAHPDSPPGARRVATLVVAPVFHVAVGGLAGFLFVSAAFFLAGCVWGLWKCVARDWRRARFLENAKRRQQAVAASKRAFAERLRWLGLTYEQYLRSGRWDAARDRYVAAGLPLACAVCGDRRCELHHRTYERLGEELPGDLVPLCREHHDRVHRMLDEAGGCVTDTDRVVATLTAARDAARGRRSG